MSDITKKIFSIEQTGDDQIRSDQPISKLIRPLADEEVSRPKPQSTEKVPEFVTREAVQPLSTPPPALVEDTEPTKAAGWIILGLGILYLIGAGLYFAPPLLLETAGPLPIAGLALLLVLPLISLFLLWQALRYLRSVSEQNAKLSKAAAILVSPDREALTRTETLAGGIREQISKVNSSLSNTVETLKEVQISTFRESQALDAAGLALSNRSDGISENLTLQRQALEGLSGTFDTRISMLSAEITEKGRALDAICTAAETKILDAGKTLEKATRVIDEAAISSADLFGAKITTLDETSQKLAETAKTFTSDLGSSTETLLATDKYFMEYSEKFQSLNAETQSQISELQATIGHGYEMLDNLKASSETRTTEVASYYENLSNQLKRSEDDTLAAQGHTARMVEANLAQMRRDFSRMETDLQSLQVKLNRMRDASDDLEHLEPQPSRLNLKPLDTDFPPVEPPRPIVRPTKVELADVPLNLGADLEIETADDQLLNFKPDLIRRPGDTGPKTKSKGFGRRTEKDEKSGWRWRDMLGTLERPDGTQGQAPSSLQAPSSSLEVDAVSSRNIDGVALLSALKLSPSAIVDEGTVVDATQARINTGEAGLTAVVKDKLPEAVAHLKQKMAADTGLKADLHAFTVDFSKMIGNTPPTAPALRAAFGSPDGRAYLLCAAAFRPELRG